MRWPSRYFLLGQFDKAFEEFIDHVRRKAEDLTDHLVREQGFRDCYQDLIVSPALFGGPQCISPALTGSALCLFCVTRHEPA